MGGSPTRLSRFALLFVLAPSFTACVSYAGQARDAEPTRIASERGWLRVGEVEGVRQRSTKDCGAAALSTVMKYWGEPATPQAIEASLTRDIGNGMFAGELKAFAEQRGLRAFVFNGAFADIERELRSGRPSIVGVAKPYDDEHLRLHYEVVLGYHPRQRRVLTFDPARGLRENTLEGFEHEWAATERVTLVVFKDANAKQAASATASGPNP
jgi:ABC-type bacteriocin/lantibiotic exporter with double-glycine peptidase domain